ncbi:MAG: DUF2182 domain-containing protein [Solirubrobacteraceae bacterium]|nr:DUF2182 domain-containing protein [Solirubrobacteraceae bacterium]
MATLLALAGLAWWSTADSMRGMDEGPGTDLGALGWFVGVWVVMMAAMMFPSVAPTVALYSRMAAGAARGVGAGLVPPRGSEVPGTGAVAMPRGSGVPGAGAVAMPRGGGVPGAGVSRVPRVGTSGARIAPAAFTAGYLLAWTAAGLLAFAISSLGRSLLGSELSWNGAGRWLAGGTLVAAAAYELTPFKDVCLAKCRSPLGFLLGSWRDGPSGALRMGTRHGAWCVGCCWALMASLFALGVMSLAWMALVAALIAAEKTLPWGRAATYGTAFVLLALGLLLMAAPDAIPGLTIPGGGDGMQ